MKLIGLVDFSKPSWSCFIQDGSVTDSNSGVQREGQPSESKCPTRPKLAKVSKVRAAGLEATVKLKSNGLRVSLEHIEKSVGASGEHHRITIATSRRGTVAKVQESS